MGLKPSSILVRPLWHQVLLVTGHIIRNLRVFGSVEFLLITMVKFGLLALNNRSEKQSVNV